MLRVENIKFVSDSQKKLKSISTVFNDGDITGIVGPSGSGKSTFLKTLNLLNMPDEGHIFLNDLDITARDVDVNKIRQRIGMVFNKPFLFNHLNIVENVMIGMTELKAVDEKEAYENACRLLEMTGLSDKAMSYPEQLSAGKQQCAAIARALSVNPEIMLMDEPTSNIDPIMKADVIDVIKKYAQSGHTIVLVTQEPELLKSVCTRIIYMKDGQILEEGSLEKMLNHPDNEEVKGFLDLLLTNKSSE